MIVELLIRVVDKVNDTSIKLDAQCRKAGDVIVWKPSPAEWGIEEVKNPDWRIVKADLTEEEANALVAPEILDKAQPDKILRKNQMRLDVAQLDALTGGKVVEDQSAKVAEIDAAIAAKTKALQDYQKKQDAAEWAKVSAADLAIIDAVKLKAIDADITAAKLMDIASLKEPIIENKFNEIGPVDNVIGG